MVSSWFLGDFVFLKTLPSFEVSGHTFQKPFQHLLDVIMEYRSGYKSLDDGEFRLINLARGSWSDPISFSLRNYSLDPAKHPYYEAVSYVWGNINSQVDVTCGEVRMGIGSSAAAALRRFRFSDRDRYVSLCPRSGQRRC